jgi:hypothetical protein
MDNILVENRIRNGRQFSPNITTGAELINFVSQIGQLIRTVTTRLYEPDPANQTTTENYTRLTIPLSSYLNDDAPVGNRLQIADVIRQLLLDTAAQTPPMEINHNLDSVVTNLSDYEEPQESNLLDVASALLSSVSQGVLGQQPQTPTNTNTRLGLDTKLFPFLKKFRKWFELLPMIKLVLFPTLGSNLNQGVSNSLFYSMFPSMLPTLMATGLFLYGGKSLITWTR